MILMHRGWILVPILALAVAAQTAKTHAPAKFRISGTVVDAVGGDALPDIEVSLAESQAQNLLQTATTGEDGRFEFDGLAAKKYAITARGRGYHQQGYEEHEGYFTGIVTGPGLESENLQFRLKSDSSISGTVTDEFNDPVPSGHVLLFRGGMVDVPQMVMLQSEVMTDDAGRYHFGRLPEGRYYVVAYGAPWYAREARDNGEDQFHVRFREGGSEEDSEEETPASGEQAVEQNQHSEFDVAFRTTYYPNASEAEQATPIVVKAGEHATADFHLFAVPALRLKVHGSSAFAKTTGDVALLEPIFNYSRMVAAPGADENGAQFSGLAPGHYVLQFPAGGAASAALQQPLDLAGDMDVAPGAGGKLVSSVIGTLQAEGNAMPCPRCFVQLTNAATGQQSGAQVTDKGFEIEGGVRAGRYIVRLFNAEDYEARTIAATGARVVGTQLEIPAGATVRLTIILTKGLGTIDGVALQDGKPVSQTPVVLLPNDPAHNLVLMRRDQSDSDGTFTLRRVLPGSYTVIAVADGWDLDWNDPSVVKAYAGGGVKVSIQPQGGKYQVKVAVQAKRN